MRVCEGLLSLANLQRAQSDICLRPSGIDFRLGSCQSLCFGHRYLSFFNLSLDVDVYHINQSRALLSHCARRGPKPGLTNSRDVVLYRFTSRLVRFEVRSSFVLGWELSWERNSLTSGGHIAKGERAEGCDGDSLGTMELSWSEFNNAVPSLRCVDSEMRLNEP